MPQFSMAQTRHCRGFSLLELLAVLALLTGLVSALLYKTLDVSVQVTQQNTETALAAADEQLRQFAAWNGRLPCPDNTGNGIEDCSGGGQKGNLPYRTLGLAAVGYTVGEQGSRAMIYGVYRNEVADADLAVTAERFKPTNADATAYDLGNENTLDFCSALEDASELAQNDNYLHISDTNGTAVAMAYMLASPGASNADGDINDDRYDGLNRTSNTGFNAPQTPVSADYDDITQGRGLAELYELLHCEISQRSLNLSANAIALEEENIAFAESNQESADQGVLMNAVGSALTAWSMGQAAAGLSGAIEVQTISTGLLATATATCAVPPFAGCALVPVYTAAVSAAGSGVTLSGIAVGLSGTALGLQIASTALYDTVADKAGVPDTVEGGLGITQDNVNDAEDAYRQADVAAMEAESTYQNELAQYESGPKAAAVASNNKLEDEILKLSGDSQDNAFDDLYGFPRPEDLDPEDPPDEADVIIGVEPAIDAWLSTAASAEQMGNVDLVDEDGNPFTDENGNPIDLDADAEAARVFASNRIAEVRQGFEATSTCIDEQVCPLVTAFDAHVEAYTAEREAWYAVEALRAKADAARTEAEGANDAYGALNCAFNFNSDYDTKTNSCTAGAPGSSAGSADQDFCDASSDAYDEDSCAAWQDAQNSNPVCEEGGEYYDADVCAAVGERAEKITMFSGMDNLVQQLDSKGTVR
ncbi:prepilin-type N-terminal cleavage/methylation domain-containing protein [Vreelandella maris]|uniref:Prepilin-type N-terminal cleavage/methylation domain-containing protein n=1 Tax=Vreelandella maris TaxID=2729617 RepID=A0A7Y6V7G3_9GAMM|nr:prepilin-type N-terminal cleavage/methylation domain-containing protein [Halomonas maris]NVF13453.1 prepilin-type N-terminal cleavage/methylation domain-containing protein [Halomonas maris]